MDIVKKIPTQELPDQLLGVTDIVQQVTDDIDGLNYWWQSGGGNKAKYFKIFNWQYIVIIHLF